MTEENLQLARLRIWPTISSSWWSATWKASLPHRSAGQLNAFLADDPAKRDAFVALCTQACLVASGIGIGEEDVECEAAEDPPMLL